MTGTSHLQVRRTTDKESIPETDVAREVLQLVAEGLANKEVAALLNASEKTVDFHKSTAELTQFAIKHRIIGI